MCAFVAQQPELCVHETLDGIGGKIVQRVGVVAGKRGRVFAYELLRSGDDGYLGYDHVVVVVSGGALYVCVHVCMHVYACNDGCLGYDDVVIVVSATPCMFVCMHVCMYMHVNIWDMMTWSLSCMGTPCMYVCMYVCMYMHASTLIHSMCQSVDS